MIAEPEERRFTLDDRSPVLRAMAELADGSGWIVADPAVQLDDEVVLPTPLGALLGAKGPPAPELSWVPGERGGRRPEPISVGIRHASGPKTRRRLAEAGCPVPPGWVVVQDNPRRGLVAQVPDTEAHATVLDWLLRAAAELTVVTLTGDWRARVHRR